MSARVSRGAYVAVFLLLWSLTAITVLVAHLDLGGLSTPAALLIASIKALLVVAFFMHLRFSDRLVWVFASAGFLWFFLLVSFVMMDVRTRGDVREDPFTDPPAAQGPEVGGDRPGVLRGEPEGGHRRAR
ncbi:MAG: cytochrome C oxidase subunit IV family protein [Vicinamibacteria bacterium]